jgi:hypothetical protein
MPEFIIEVTSKRVFGPFTFPTSQAVMDAILDGDLNMTDQEETEANNPVVFKVKEIKEKPPVD